MLADHEIAEKRREKRYELNFAAKARLLLTPLGKRVDVRVVNISRSGLSFRTARQIPTGSDVYLILNNEHYRLTPVWELPGVGPKPSITYGFNCARKNVDLVNAFASAGLPLSKAKEKFQTDEERFIEEFDTIQFEAFPPAAAKKP